VSQLPTGTSSSVVAIIEDSENTPSTITQVAVVVSQSEENTIIVPPSDTASSARSAAVNALKFALQHLGKAPLPGIGVVAGFILDVINRIQTKAVVGNDLTKLTLRMASLGYLVSNVDKIDGSATLVERLNEELRGLASDLESASKQNKV